LRESVALRSREFGASSFLADNGFEARSPFAVSFDYFVTHEMISSLVNPAFGLHAFTLFVFAQVEPLEAGDVLMTMGW
jgi:hypothetical protein